MDEWLLTYEIILIKSHTVHSTSKQMSHIHTHTHTRTQLKHIEIYLFSNARKIKLFAIDLHFSVSHLLECVAVFKICAIVQNTQRQDRHRKICFSKLLTPADKMKNVFLSIHQTLGVLSSPIHFGKPSTICMIGSYQFISEAIFFTLFFFISVVFYRWMHSGE